MKIAFSDIELGPLLGTGTVGAVYRGKLKATGQVVAVKLLLPAISNDPLVRARFEREMAILERLQHPNIIRYFGGGKHEGQLFYAMESLECGSAKELLERYESLSWKEVASIARQVSSALQHAHNYGIIHRDLKPSNLFLTDAGQIKLGDFGIALDTHSADLTQDGLTVGTHAYMSPEQITGDSNLTGKADLYSLGCVLFELLTGHKPFQGTNFAMLFEQHLRKTAPRVSDYVPDCPKEMVEIVAQLLEKDPNNRPFNARAVQGVMLELLEDAATASPDQSRIINQAQNDVAAGEVEDPGMASLARKLTPGTQHNVSWQNIVIIALTAIVLILLVTLGSR